MPPKTMFARSFVSDPRLNWHLMDVGGNIGAAAIFLMNHIEGRLRSVDFIEPEMSNTTLVKKNLRGSTAECGFTFHQAALVGNERIYDGKIKFSVANSKYNRYRHCLTEYQVVADATHERVAAIRFSTLLREVAQPALFLKLDCEGPERHILTILAKAMSEGRMPDCTRMVLVIAEVSWDNIGWGVDEYREWLEELQQVGLDWSAMEMKASAPPLGAEPGGFTRSSVNAASRLENLLPEAVD